MSKRNNVIKFTRRPNFNIGLIIFGVIFIYLVISIIIFSTSKKTVIYEVNAGSLAFDTTYTGFIIRSERVYTAEYSGRVNYFLNSGERAAINTTVYSVDETGRVADKIEENLVVELNDSEINVIKDMISNYSSSYSSDSFSDIYNQSKEISDKIYEFKTNTIFNNLDDYISQTESEALFHKITAEKTGLVTYVIDGYEHYTENALTEELFNTENYTSTSLLNTKHINKGDSAYKLITNENWYVCFPLNATEATALNGVTSIDVEFVNTDISCPVNFELINVNGNSYGKISLDKYVVNFLDKRFVQIKISVDNFHGLKIPVTSVFEKSFYTIPKEYLTPSGTFIKKYFNEKGEIVTTAIDAEIYEENDKYYYVSMDTFKSGDMLMLPNSDETYIVGTMEELNGVYCINRGYAVFKKVDILKQNSEYCIVRKGTSYGLAIYDHIVLDYTTVKENEIVN